MEVVEEDHYKVLEVGREATLVEIRKSYRRLALQWHPDKNPGNLAEATQKFKLISAAFAVLNDASKRFAYDEGQHQGTFQAPSTFQTESYIPCWFTYVSCPSTPSTFTFMNTFYFSSQSPCIVSFGPSTPGSRIQFVFHQQPTATTMEGEFYNGRVEAKESRTEIRNGVRTTEVYEDGELISSKKVQIG